MENAVILAELLNIKDAKFQNSYYAGIEICWKDENNENRIITYVNSGHEFCYTKNADGLPGNWQEVDYWFLYLN